MFTITTMPSKAITVGASSASSASLRARLAMPISQVPLMAAVIPAVELFTAFNVQVAAVIRLPYR